MEINFNSSELIFVSKLLKGVTDSNNPFTIITTWNTKAWVLDDIIFENSNDDTQENRDEITKQFNTKMAI